MIEVTEGVDHHGWYFVRASGKTARTLAQLAETLGVAESQLGLLVKARKRRPDPAWLNTAERIEGRCEFDLF